mmetsp:Transcript_21608/g.44430  ORF Transcript_21608/g.44430 Transcript_21608/m.44430 type:complete len:504 (+) Transcript_21608:54-1565(+)
MQKYLVALTIVGIVDAISYMLVTPSLVFYVLQNGGSQQQYGIIMSAFSFSSFCTKPFIGWWSDKQGFRVPYIASVAVAFLGGVGYVLASALPKGSVAVNAILLARLLGGCGAANSALGFAYVARSVPPAEQTSTNSLLSLCRILGMAVGPALNVLVAKVNIPITPKWNLDSLNSVGIVLVIANLISAIAVYCLLEEPKENKGNEDSDVGEVGDATDSPSKTGSSSSASAAFLSFLSLDIMVPMLSIFTFNANFQLIETGFAPAANDALGWGPVESSIALGSLSVLIAANMFSVIKLSKSGISDSNLLCGGLVGSIVGYTALYLFWIKDSNTWYFVLPILFSASSFPYMAATTRSIFTVSVSTKPALKEYHGFMQAVLSMAASVAGFTTPGVVAAYLLRSPEEVVASSDMRELTPYSLFAPALSLLVLLGMVYLRWSGAIGKAVADSESCADESGLDQEAPTESSTLLSPTQSKRRQRRSSNLAIMFEGQFDAGLLEESTRETL